MKRQKNMPLLKEGLSASNCNPRGPIGVKRGNRIKKEREWYPGQEERLQGRVGIRILTPRTPSNMLVRYSQPENTKHHSRCNCKASPRQGTN